MNCRVADQLIQQALDVPLSPPERARLDAHRDACPACRRTWDEYRALSRAADAWVRRPDARETPPDEFTAQVLARALAAPAAPASASWARLVAVALVAAGVAALSPMVSPLLPTLPAWHVAWAAPALPDVLPSARALPGDVTGLWDAVSGWLSPPLAAVLVAIALPVNALLCLRARGGRRRTA